MSGKQLSLRQQLVELNDAQWKLLERELLAVLPKDDIDEELSAQYDLVIPQGVDGYRVAVDETIEAIRKVLS